MCPNTTEITNVKDPTLIQSVATRNYVDSKIGSASYQLVSTAGGGITFSSSNNIIAILNGTLTHAVVFPAAASLQIGARIVLNNTSTQDCIVESTTAQTTISPGEVQGYVLISPAQSNYIANLFIIEQTILSRGTQLLYQQLLLRKTTTRVLLMVSYNDKLMLVYTKAH